MSASSGQITAAHPVKIPSLSKQSHYIPMKISIVVGNIFAREKSSYFAGQIFAPKRSFPPLTPMTHRRGSGSRRGRSWTIGGRSTHCSTYMLHFAGIFPYIWVTKGKYMHIFHEELRYLRGGIVLLEQRGRFEMVYYYHLPPFTYILVGFHRGNPVFTNQPVGKVRLCKVPPNSLGEFYGF